jgi:hypothetical protein
VQSRKLELHKVTVTEKRGNNKMLKAIETYYNGYRFRSRLEARWAVFFDAMHVKYQYELEGYDLGTAGYYLPDFYLSDYRIFVEVKPLYNITDQERLKASELSKQSNLPVLIVFNCSEKQTHLLFFKGDKWSVCLMACTKCNALGFLNLETAQCLYPCGSCENECDKNFIKPLHKLDSYSFSEQHQKLLSSTLAAQQARFEHGETPIVRH